jgi:hypothetical protein
MQSSYQLVDALDSSGTCWLSTKNGSSRLKIYRPVWLRALLYCTAEGSRLWPEIDILLAALCSSLVVNWCEDSH